MSCNNCPIKIHCPDKQCVVEKFNATNLCDKVDPSHSEYHSAYVTIIADKSCGTNNYVSTSRSNNESPAKKELPSLSKQAKNFVGSMIDYAKDGFKNSSEEEVIRRISICESCELFRHNDRRCSHESCGCFMDVKVKLKSASCPLGLW